MGYRYIGSKEKLANSIIELIRQEVPTAQTIVDLMAGTGNFSLALRNQGYKVIASDVMRYSYHHLTVNLLLKEAPPFNGLIEKIPNIVKDSNKNYYLVLDYLNKLNGIESYFFNEFSPEGNPHNTNNPRKYYTSFNAKKIDVIRKEIKNWYEEKKITSIEHSLLLHTLILSSNDIANIAGTYGHYLSHFVSRSLDPLILKPVVLPTDNNIEHTIYCEYAESLAKKIKGDIVYIDPPYNKRQYAANYHILETIAREDCPEAIGVSGLRPWRDKYSNFCSKIKIRESFSKIIKTINSDHIFISYSEDGLLTLNELKDFLSTFGEIKVHTIKYKRFKSNNSKKNPILTEYLIYLKKWKQ